MTHPRVLLVEDDPSLQRFVEMALELMPLELHCRDSVAGAIEMLQQAPVSLLITDLLLPDGSGRDLLARLNAEPALRGQARVMVFSAGLDDTISAELVKAGAWRTLAKPCSLDDLERCVSEGLAAAAADSPAAAAAAAPAAVDALQQHFAGNAALYQAFRASCLQQFAQDIEAGEAACRARDGQALRRLAHSLKSVLLTLGHTAESMDAAALELAADAADWPHALPLWQSLRQGLTAMR